MCENTDQRICIRFCFKVGQRGIETYEMMKTVLGDETMSCARVCEWFRRFKEGRQSMNCDPRSGRPSTTRDEDKIAQVKAVVRSDRRLSVREIAQGCHVFVGSGDEILRKDLSMHRVPAKFVPRLLKEVQQFQRLATSSDLFQCASDVSEFMELNHPWGLVVGSRIRSRNKAALVTIENSRFCSAKESTAGAIKDESNVDCVFRCRWNCSSCLRSAGADSEQKILLDIMWR
ncbi:protein GVQW3 [Trichonephila clavipes]|nr:protein GVQW3 [Trichonephila clavipes]